MWVAATAVLVSGLMTETSPRAAALPPILAQQVDDDPLKPSQTFLQEENEGVSDNGLHLSINAAVAEDGEPRVIVKWSLRYDGMRWPLVVLKPTLKLHTSGQTSLGVTVTGKSGNVYTAIFPSPELAVLGFPLIGLPTKEDFLVLRKKTAPKGESGTVELPVADIGGRFRKYLPAEFGEKPPKVVRITMTHAPRDRGGDYNLDAWTGSVTSRWRTVQLSEW